MLRALFTFSAVFFYLSLYRLLSFLCLSIPNHPPSFFPHTFDKNRDRRGSGTARSFPRLTVHSPMPLPFVVIVHETLSAQIFTDAPPKSRRSYTLYRRSPRNRIAHLGRMHGRRISIRQREFYAHTRKNSYAIIKLIHDTHTHIYAHICTYIYTWAHMSKLQCYSVRITYTLVQKRVRSNDEVTKQNKKKSRFTIGYL